MTITIDRHWGYYSLWILTLVVMIVLAYSGKPTQIPSYQTIQIPHIYIISLPKASLRRAKINLMLKRFNISYSFIEGVNGWKLDVDNLKRQGILATSYQPNSFNPGHLGCYLSHLKVYSEMIKRNHKSAIILEDDVCLKLDFVQRLQHLEKHCPQEYDLIWLGYHSQEYWYKNNHKQDFDSQLCFSKGALGTYAYLINSNYAHSLLHNSFPIQKAIDVILMEKAREVPYRNFLSKSQWVESYFSDTVSQTSNR